MVGVFSEFDGLAAASGLPARPLHLAIGMFDGVHLGHRAVIDAAIRSARSDQGISAVLTFDPHPSRLFRPHQPVQLIMTPGIKSHLLAEAGVDHVINQTFDADYASIKAEDFVAHIQQHLPALKALYVGENWRFGHKRAGDVDLLTKEAVRTGIEVFSAPRISHNGSPISSTRIRQLLTTGEMAAANALLGYPYRSEGRVTAGRRLGRTLGFPTLNLPWEAELEPRYGVYAVRVRATDADAPGLDAVANFGLRPTVESATVAARLEVHVLDPKAVVAAGWREGTGLRVNWLSFLRPEKKFADLEALRMQIAQDRREAGDFFLR